MAQPPHRQHAAACGGSESSSQHPRLEPQDRQWTRRVAVQKTMHAVVGCHAPLRVCQVLATWREQISDGESPSPALTRLVH